MKNSMLSITLKLALFLMIASGIMLFVTVFGSAEWYISLFSCLLMLVLVVIIAVILHKRERK